MAFGLIGEARKTVGSRCCQIVMVTLFSCSTAVSNRAPPDMPLAIEKEHPQQLASCAQQVGGNHADRALALDRPAAGLSGEERASHGRDGERHHRCAAGKPAPRKGRGTTVERLASALAWCASRGRPGGVIPSPQGPPSRSVSMVTSAWLSRGLSCAAWVVWSR